MNEIFEFPPFPRLTTNTGFWSGRVRLKTWLDYGTSPDCYDTDIMADIVDGSAHLYIAMPYEQQNKTPTSAQIAAYEYLLKNEEVIQLSILQAIFEEYPVRREAYGYDESECMPAVEQLDQFKLLIGLGEVVILNAAKRGIAYVLFEFRAAWDPEHSFNVTTHKDRVIRVGNSGDGEYHAEKDAQIVEGS